MMDGGAGEGVAAGWSAGEPRRRPPVVFIPQSAYMNKRWPVADDEEIMGAGDDCLICSSRKFLLQCFGHRGASMKTGAAEQSHTVCKNCLDKWFSAHNELRASVGLLPHSRHSCPVCRCLLRGSSLRSKKHCLGLLKVPETWPEGDCGPDEDEEEEAKKVVTQEKEEEEAVASGKEAAQDEEGVREEEEKEADEDDDEEAGEEAGEEEEGEEEGEEEEGEEEEGEEEEGDGVEEEEGDEAEVFEMEAAEVGEDSEEERAHDSGSDSDSDDGDIPLRKPIRHQPSVSTSSARRPDNRSSAEGMAPAEVMAPSRAAEAQRQRQGRKTTEVVVEPSEEVQPIPMESTGRKAKELRSRLR
jgi:hypothetical protein